MAEIDFASEGDKMFFRIFPILSFSLLLLSIMRGMLVEEGWTFNKPDKGMVFEILVLENAFPVATKRARMIHVLRNIVN